MAKTAKMAKNSDSMDDMREGVLETQFQRSQDAFSSWRSSQDRSDKSLYLALGSLAEFMAAAGNNPDSIINFAEIRGVRITKATTPAVAVTKLVITDDSSRASKYATVLKFCSLSGIEPVAGIVAEFIESSGGIEACLKAYKLMPASGSAKSGAGRPSAYGKALSRISEIARIKAPKDLAVTTSEDGYFVMVGVKDADGNLHFLQHKIDDEKFIRSAVSLLAQGE